MPSSSGPPLALLSPSALYFPEPHDRVIENHLQLSSATLKNANSSAKDKHQYLVFGIKSTTPARYVVRPRYGLIKPDGSADVSIALRDTACFIEASAASPPDARTLANLQPVKKLVDKFQIDIRAVDCEANDKTLTKLLLKDASHHNGKEEQALIRELYKSSTEAKTAHSSLQVHCNFYDVSVANQSGRSNTGKVVIPAEANVLIKNSGGGHTRVVSPSSEAPAAADANTANNTDGKPPLPPGGSKSSGSATAKPSSSRGRTPSPNGGEGGNSELAELKNKIDTKQKEHDDLSTKLAKLEEELTAVRKDNDDVIATTARTATLLKKYKSAVVKNGGKAPLPQANKGGKKKKDNETKAMLPFSVIILVVVVTFCGTYWFRDLLPKAPMQRSSDPTLKINSDDVDTASAAIVEDDGEM